MQLLTYQEVVPGKSRKLVTSSSQFDKKKVKSVNSEVTASRVCGEELVRAGTGLISPP